MVLVLVSVILFSKDMIGFILAPGLREQIIITLRIPSIPGWLKLVVSLIIVLVIGSITTVI